MTPPPPLNKVARTKIYKMPQNYQKLMIMRIVHKYSEITDRVKTFLQRQTDNKNPNFRFDPKVFHQVNNRAMEALAETTVTQ